MKEGTGLPSANVRLGLVNVIQHSATLGCRCANTLSACAQHVLYTPHCPQQRCCMQPPENPVGQPRHAHLNGLPLTSVFWFATCFVTRARQVIALVASMLKKGSGSCCTPASMKHVSLGLSCLELPAGSAACPAAVAAAAGTPAAVTAAWPVRPSSLSLATACCTPLASCSAVARPTAVGTAASRAGAAASCRPWPPSCS